MSPEKRLDLITRRTTGISGVSIIKDALSSERAPRCFWATAPTGKPHIAYLVPLIKLAEFVRAGVEVTILFCDLYAFLVNYKDPMEVVQARTKYYRYAIRAVLNELGVPKDKVRFVDGSSYELSPRFTMENYRLCTLVNDFEARATGDEYRNATKLSVLLCPGLPALAEEYLDADMQFGGEDQAGLFAFNENFLPRLGYRRRAHLMNHMIPGLNGPKMSSSIPDSKIGLLEDSASVHGRLQEAHCVDGVIDGNGVLPILKEIIFPLASLRQELLPQAPPSDNTHARALFSIPLTGTADGPAQSFSSYADLEHAFVTGDVSGNCLKSATAEFIDAFLAPVRLARTMDQEWQHQEALAYAEE